MSEIASLRQQVAELERIIKQDADQLMMRDKIIRERDERVEDLEEDLARVEERCRFYATHLNCGEVERKYKQRGERMKALIKYVPFGLRQELLATWFDKTGEPL